MLKKLIKEDWHTALTLKTDDEGYIEFRGFYGDYILTCGDLTKNFGIHKD